MLIFVVADIASLLIVYLLLERLDKINDQYLDILQNNIVKMSNFTVEVRSVTLDKTVQDMRILKMKLWLHFTRVLRKCHEEYSIEEPSDEDLSDRFSSDDELDAPRISIDSEDDLGEQRLKDKSRLVQVADIQFGRYF
jgi:hypothetical protein